MIRKFWMLAAAALTLGLAQSPVLGQSGPPASGDSAAVFFIPGTVNLVAGLNGQGTPGDPTTWGDGGLATAAKLSEPFGVAYDSKGNLYITDSGNDDVRKIDSATGDISLFAGTGSFGDTAPGANAQATTVALGAVTGLVVDSSDNVYFADRQNNVVWKVDTAGVITIFAGNITTSGYTGDGGLATSATLYSPYGLAFDASGNLYIADTGNNVVRVVGTNGKINTFAGNGTGAGQYNACPGNIPALGPPAPAATKVALCDPYGVAADASGNVYVSSYAYEQVYKVSTNGDLSLFAGTGANYNVPNCCETGDGGPATSAEIWRPFGLYADPVGDVYIVDQFGSYVRQVDTAGIISKVYGDGSGDITKAVLGTPDIVAEAFNVGDANGIYFITMDADGNLVVPSTGVILSAGSTGNYFFGYNNQLYSTSTSTSLNAVSPGFPPYITISNPSGVTLTFTGTPTITGPFGIAGGTCTFPGSVAPGDSCTVIPSFTPTVDGAATGSIAIPSNANNVTQSITQNTSPLTITLEGSGTGSVPPPLFTLTPSNMTFASPTGVQSAAQQLTLKNTGQVPFTIYSYQIQNGPTFSVSPLSCPSAGSATSIPVGASCTFDVTFTPAAPTTYAAGLQVCVSSPSYSDYCNSGQSGNGVSLSGTGTGSVSFTSPPLAFGGVVVGQTSAALSATLNNGGADGLNIQSISITGANLADFSIATGPNACVVGNVLDGGGLPGSTCNIYVTFTPGSAVSFTGTLQVVLQNPSTNPPTTMTEQLALSGTGVVFSSGVGTAQASQSVTVNISTAGTPSAINVLTDGVANLDFGMTGGTCAPGTAYTIGQTCSVNVQFDPAYPGARNGAIELIDAGGNVLGTTYLPGLGFGPEIAFEPGTQSTLPSYSGGAYSAPLGVTVDEALNVYVVDTLNGRIIKIPWNGVGFGTPVNLSISGLNQPSAVAVDGNGDLFIADTKNYRIVELPWTGSAYGTRVVLDAIGLPDPTGIAVDGNGNLFFTDGLDQKLVEMAWTGTGYGAPTTITQASGLFSPHGVAVDSSGDVFIADSDNSRVVEVLRTSTGFGTEVVLATGLFYPEAVAVDAGGNVYIGNTDAGAVMELPFDGTSYGSPITLPFSGLRNPAGVAVDPTGNVYVADATNNDVVELNVTTPPALTFALTDVGSTSSDSPKTVTVYNIGNGDLYFNAQNNNPVYPGDFPVNSNDQNLCEEDNSVQPGSSCDVSVNFTPTMGGYHVEDVMLTDNNLGVGGVTQSISVSGTGTEATAPAVSFNPPSLTFSVPSGSTSPVQMATLTNSGTAPLNITSTGLTGANDEAFIESDNCVAKSPIPINGTCTISVQFAPNSTGPFTAAVSITDNAAHSPQSLPLNGTGTTAGAPIVTLTPALAFPATPTTQGQQLMATLSNTGNAPLTNIKISITGANADVFDIYGNGSCYSVSTLAADSSCTISVDFYPPGPNNYAAVLTVTDNATGSPQTSILTGEGTEPELQFSPGQFTYIAGTPGSLGDTGSGPAASALIGGGYGIALDAGGQVYFSDYDFNTVWQIDYSGNIHVFAGTPVEAPGHGSYSGDNGPAASATLDAPEQIAFDPSGNLYIADRFNNLIRMVNSAGIITTFAGSYGNGFGGYAGDGGPANQATLDNPQGVTSDALGNIYIADTDNFVIRKVDTTGTITLFAGTPGVNGYSGDNGPATSAKLGQCYQLATDQNGNLFIADFSNGVVRKVDSSGTITTYAGGGTTAVTATPQPATSVNLNNGPVGLATDPGGNLYVLGLGQTNTPGVFVVNASQQISQIVGGSIALNSGSPANVETINPNAIALDNSGNLYINDAYNHLVSEVGPNGDLLFPDTPVNTTSAPLTLRLTNTGNAPLSFMSPNEDDVVRGKPGRSAINSKGEKGSIKRPHSNVVDFNTYGSITGPFAIASGGSCNFDDGIPAGASCTMNVTFTPTGTGAASGSIFLYTSSGTGGTNTNYVQLAGNGTAASSPPGANLTTSLAFPNTNVASTSTALAATLSNTGGSTLNISSIAIGGANPPDFAITTGSNACATTLAVEASCSIYVTFTPSSAAGFSATLTVTDNASPATQASALTGTGLALSPQAIGFTQPASVTYSPTLAVSLVATGGASGNPVVFSIDPSSTGTGSISGSTLTVSSVGNFVIDANQAGNSAYTAATQVQKAFVVSQAPQAINFTQPTTPIVFSSGLTIALTATGGASGNAVIFTLDESSTATGTISGNTVTLTSAGNLVIDANQAGNADYSAAPQVQHTVLVSPPPPDFTITATPPSQTVAAGASAAYSVTIAAINGTFNNVVTLSAAGLPTGANGTFAPTTITPGNSNGASTFTVQLAPALQASAYGSSAHGSSWPLATPALALLFLLPFRRWRKAWRGKLLLLVAGLVSLAALLNLTACGGGFLLGPVSQTYTITLTGASGNDTHSTTVQLTVK